MIRSSSFPIAALFAAQSVLVGAAQAQEAAGQAAAETAAQTVTDAAAAQAAEAGQAVVEAATGAGEKAAEDAAKAVGDAAEQAAQGAAPAAAEQPQPAETAQQAGEAAQPAPQEPTRTAYDDWTLICAPSGAPCVMDQIGTNEAGGAVLNIQIERLPQPVKVGKNDVKEMVNVLVPLGVWLREGVKMQIDGGQVLTSEYFICQPNGCLVQAPLQPSLLNALKRGAVARFNYVGVDVNRNQPVEVATEISLKGFTAAFNALP